MDEFRALWIFTEVARAGGFTKAAEGLGLTVGAVSRSVTRLEAELHTRLFVRTTRNIRMTDEGQQLLDRVAGRFDEIRAAAAHVRDASPTPRGTVRVSAGSGWGKRMLLPMLNDFFAEYPDVHVILSLRDGTQGPGRQGYDVRLNWGELLEPDKVAHTVQLMTLVIVGSPAYLRARGRPETPEELGDHDWIIAEQENGQHFGWGLRPPSKRGGRSQNFRVGPAARLVIRGELDGTLDAAVAGLGLTIVARSIAEQPIAAGQLETLLDDYEVIGSATRNTTLVLQHPPRNEMTPAVRAFVGFLDARLYG